MPDLPARFDGASLERVLARASELQAQQQAGQAGDGLTEAQLVELGREVGLDATAMRQAMAEELSRANVVRDRSLMSRVAGSAMASAERTVAGTPADVLEVLDTWMRRQEYLQLKRRYASRLSWEPQRDLVASVTRSVERVVGGREHAFARAAEVSAFVTPVDATRVHVRLDADLTPLRSASVWGGAGLGAAGGVATAILLVLNVMPVIALLPFATLPLAGLAAARTFRRPVARAQLALDQLLDRLESGEMKRRGGLLDALKQVALPPTR